MAGGVTPGGGAGGPASAAARPRPIPTRGGRQSAVTGLVFLLACVLDLPLVYHLVRVDEDARLAPLVIVFAASSMALAFAGGLAIEGKRPGVAAAIAAVAIAEAPLLWWAAGAVARFTIVPTLAVQWAFAVAGVSVIALVLSSPLAVARPGRDAA